QADMGVLDVAQEVLFAARVIEPDDRGAGERGASEREQVVGRVVEEHTDVQGAAGRRAREEHLGPAGRLVDVLTVGPRAVTEPDGRTAPDRGVRRVPAQ